MVTCCIKNKIKRIKKFVTNAGDHGADIELGTISNRLSVLENANLTICSKLDEVKVEVSTLNLSSTATPSKTTLKTAASLQNASLSNTDKKLIKSLTDSVKEMHDILDKSEKNVDELKRLSTTQNPSNATWNHGAKVYLREPIAKGSTRSTVLSLP